MQKNGKRKILFVEYYCNKTKLKLLITESQWYDITRVRGFM